MDVIVVRPELTSLIRDKVNAPVGYIFEITLELASINPYPQTVRLNIDLREYQHFEKEGIGSVVFHASLCGDAKITHDSSGLKRVGKAKKITVIPLNLPYSNLTLDVLVPEENILIFTPESPQGQSNLHYARIGFTLELHREILPYMDAAL